MITKILSAARKLWAEEPVIVGSALPLLVMSGVITSEQSGLIGKAIAAVVSALASIVAVVKVRRKVTPTRKVA